MRHCGVRAILLLLFAALVGVGQSQQIQSTYADLTIPGNWQSANEHAAAQFGSDIFYDSNTGALLTVRQQAGLQRAGEIARYFGDSRDSAKDAAGVMSAAAFPLPIAYTEKASRDLVKGAKPPRMWDLKEGDGNPAWFYASQLFDDYRMRNAGGSSEVSEQFMTVRVTKAEQRSLVGGDVLLFEVETEKAANDAALKRFHMPASLKDQRIRYGWVQFAPGGIASGQGVLSVGFAVPANSSLSIEEVAKQTSAAKIKAL
jgi:hypothetical protein